MKIDDYVDVLSRWYVPPLMYIGAAILLSIILASLGGSVSGFIQVIGIILIMLPIGIVMLFAGSTRSDPGEWIVVLSYVLVIGSYLSIIVTRYVIKAQAYTRIALIIFILLLILAVSGCLVGITTYSI